MEKAGDADGLAGDEGHVVGGGQVVVVRQAVCIGEMGMDRPQLGGPLVHQLGKGLQASGNLLGNDVGGIVGRGEHHGVHGVPDGELFPGLQVNGGAPGGDVRRLGAGGEHLVLLQIFHGQQAGEDLGDAGRGHQLIPVFAVEHLAGVGIHQQGSRRRKILRPGNLGSSRQRQQEKKREKKGQCLHGYLR